MHDTLAAGSRELADSSVRSRSLDDLDWLAKDAQLLVPLVELVENGERAIDEVTDVIVRAKVEAVLLMSAEQLAGATAQGRRGPDREVYWHGVQGGPRPRGPASPSKGGTCGSPSRRLRKNRPRAGKSGEVEIPGGCS